MEKLDLLSEENNLVKGNDGVKISFEDVNCRFKIK